MMHYDVYLNKGYPIATGVVEGTCGSLVKDRQEVSARVGGFGLGAQSPQRIQAGSWARPIRCGSGTYPLRVWHELGGEVRRLVEVGDGGLHYLDLEIREDRKILRHNNKFGKRYPERY
jgi:hypothetical protein